MRFKTMQRGCYPDPPKKYRYVLWRIWDEKKPRLLFIGLNPSVADAVRDDRTITRCIDYARRWGYGSLYMVNLFALRSTNCDALYTEKDPVGPKNKKVIREFIKKTSCVVLGWGNHGTHLNQDKAVLTLVKNPMCLKVTKEGQPGHPLYLHSRLNLIPYKNTAAR